MIVSEYAPDGSLEQWLKQNGKMSVERAVETTIYILDGLEFLHSRNIIHRDLKPANILLQGKTPRLADFGISRALRTTVASQSQHISGTFAYMSPEALDGKRSVQTDIWSVGVNLYQFLTGGLPFPQKEPSVLIAAIMMRESEPMPDDIPQAVKNIVTKALAKQPENRYKTAGEMRGDLKKVLVNVSFPQFAPTEVLHKPIFPVIETEKPFIQPDKPTFEIDAQSIQTRIQPTQTEKETEQFTRPAIETQPSSDAPSIVTQIIALQTKESAKPLPTVAQPFAGKMRASAKNNKLLLYGATAVLGLFLVLGILGIYNLQSPKVSNSNIAGNSNTSGNSLTNANTLANNLTTPSVADGRLIPYRKGDKWGFSDSTKKIIIEPKFENAEPLAEDLANVKFNGKWGYIDKNGNEGIAFKYDSAEPFEDGVALIFIVKGSQEITSCCYGIIDKTGVEITPPKFRSAHNFSEGLAIVGSSASIWRSGYIDTTGKLVIPTNYASTADFSEGLACVGYDPDIEKNMGRGYINTEKYGFIDKTGKIIIPFKYWRARSFSEGLAAALPPDEKSGWGFIDKIGSQVIAFKYDDAREFHEGLAPVKLGEVWGFIDKTGVEIIPFKFKYPNSFSEGLAAVQFNGKYGFIDKSGKEVIPFKYDDANDFRDGIAKVTLNEKKFYIGKDGTEYYEP